MQLRIGISALYKVVIVADLLESRLLAFTLHDALVPHLMPLSGARGHDQLAQRLLLSACRSHFVLWEML